MMLELYVNLERRLAQAEASSVSILSSYCEIADSQDSCQIKTKDEVVDGVSIDFEALIDLYLDSERSRTRQIIWEFVCENAQHRVDELKMRDVGIAVLH